MPREFGAQLQNPRMVGTRRRHRRIRQSRLGPLQGFLTPASTSLAECLGRLFAIEMNDPLGDYLKWFALRGIEALGWNGQQLAPENDGARPVALRLCDLKPTDSRSGRKPAACQAGKYSLGTVQETGFQIVLTQFIVSLIAHLFRQIHPPRQVFMHPDGPIRLTPSAK